MPRVGVAQKRREQLIAATLECVGQHGVEGTTISKIRNQAGVSSGVVHHYFHNKDELLEATMRLLLARLKHSVKSKRLSAKTHRECLNAIIEGNFLSKQVEGQSTRVWLSFWSEALLREDLARLQAVNLGRLYSNLTYHLKQLLPYEHATLIASGLVALIDGMWLRGAFQEKGIDPRHSILVCEHYLDMTLEKSSVAT